MLCGTLYLLPRCPPPTGALSAAPETLRHVCLDPRHLCLVRVETLCCEFDLPRLQSISRVRGCRDTLGSEEMALLTVGPTGPFLSSKVDLAPTV